MAYEKRKQAVITRVEPKGAPKSKMKKPMARLAGGKKAGVTTITFKGKDGRNYTTGAAKSSADRRYESQGRKAREAYPSAVKGSQKEADLIEKRKKLNK